jgi:electron transfer flavoprotein alpha subunit
LSGGILIKLKEEIMVISDSKKQDNEHLFQIISKARSLAEDSGNCVTVLCIGNYSKEQLSEYIKYGADTVLLNNQINYPTIKAFCDIATEIIKFQKPKVILFPASHFGKAAAAVLSTRFEAGLTADCIEVEVNENKDFFFSRAAINDSVIARIQCINCKLMMCTVKKDVFVKKQFENDRQGKIEEFNYEIGGGYEENYFEVIESLEIFVKPTIDINKFPIVFCIGRGVHTEEMRNRIFELAQKFGAGVVGTRTAVEDHLVEKERQVGQSGKSISPHIYVGFGVSGTSQHMVGIKNASIIIAVNNDENAAIFDYADYSIIEDLNVVVDEMERMLS